MHTSQFETYLLPQKIKFFGKFDIFSYHRGRYTDRKNFPTSQYHFWKFCILFRNIGIGSEIIEHLGTGPESIVDAEASLSYTNCVGTHFAQSFRIPKYIISNA